MLNERERSYIDAVCDHVRWKQAHNSIRRELGDHIEDQREAFIGEGMPPEAASAAAVREMGDIELVGSRMDRAYKPRISAKLMIVFAAILVLGFVFRGVMGRTDEQSIFCFGFGAVMFLIILRFWNVGWMFDKAWWFIGIYTAIMAVIPFIPLIDLGFTLLPVVNGVITQLLYLQLLQPIVFAMFVWKLKDKGILGAGATLPFVLVSLVPLLVAPNFFMAGVLGLTDLAILLYAIAKGWFGEKKWLLFGIICGVSALMIVYAIFFIFDGFYYGRLGGMFSADSWQGMMTRDVLGHCRFFGGAELSAMRYEAVNFIDYSIHTTLLTCAAKVGLWVYFAVAVLVGGLIAGMIKLCLREKTMLCRIMSLAITGTFFVQFAGCFAENLGAGIGTFPMPFIDYGNTSMIINMALMGMLFCILAKGWMYSDEPVREENQLKMS